jgi:hypothetical protein
MGDAKWYKVSCSLLTRAKLNFPRQVILVLVEVVDVVEIAHYYLVSEMT